MGNSRIVSIGCAVVAAVPLAGCYYPAPVYAPAPQTTSVPASFDASWQAARGAAADQGVQITDENRSSGTIRGTQGASEVTITVAQQADGSVRVGFNVKGPAGSGLQERLTQSYNRRMGR
jgi:hypothetical protein